MGPWDSYGIAYSLGAEVSAASSSAMRVRSMRLRPAIEGAVGSPVRSSRSSVS